PDYLWANIFKACTIGIPDRQFQQHLFIFVFLISRLNKGYSFLTQLHNTGFSASFIETPIIGNFLLV
ncbi:MAG TPA: hypothetical protein V6D12_12425, partial [Candidatus Obscuribacterales bacterium]